MRVRIKSVQLLTIMMVFAACGALFLLAIGNDALQERNDFQFFADSNTYHQIHSGERISFDGTLIGVASNYLGPLLVLDMTGANTYLVMLLNVLLFCYSVLRITALLKLDPLKVGAVLLLSPLMVSSLLSVNKEIFTLPFVAFALTGYMRKSAFHVVLALAVSILARWQLTVFYLALLGACAALVVVKRKGVVLAGLIAALSLVYMVLFAWLEPIISYAESAIARYEESGTGLFERMLELQNQGLYFLVFPFKALHLLFGMGLKVDSFLSPDEVYNDLFVSGHCAVSLIVFLALAIRRRLTLKSDLIFATAIFLAVFCLTPVFTPRYLVPVYVAWVLVLCGAPMKLPRQKLRRRRVSPTSLSEVPA